MIYIVCGRLPDVQTITTEADSKQLQTGIDNLQQWESDWLMFFNPDKREDIRNTTKQKQRITSYNVHGKEMAVTTKAKFLGVNISNNLSWNHHIDRICKKVSEKGWVLTQSNQVKLRMR